MQKITITSLPLDALVTVVSHLDSLSLLTVATVNRTLRAAAEDESLWSARARRYLGPVLQAYFGGELPSRPPGAGAKQGYFALYAGWKQLAQERSGRLLLKIGKPRSRGDWAGEWQRWQTGTYQTSSGASAVCFGLPTSQCEAYGVFDATDFDHPGSNELLGQAAARPDASDAFRLGRHSGLAMRMLAGMGVPGLEAVPCDAALEKLLARSSRRRPRPSAELEEGGLRDRLRAACSAWRGSPPHGSEHRPVQECFSPFALVACFACVAIALRCYETSYARAHGWPSPKLGSLLQRDRPGGDLWQTALEERRLAIAGREGRARHCEADHAACLSEERELSVRSPL